jgi:tRNA-uridine 2-sulfurtransferase
VSRDAGTGRYVLSKAADRAKDQTYFLCMLTQAQLARVLFPLAGLTKAEVRAIAHDRGLHVADKAESQDFAGGGDYRTLLGRGDGDEGGEIRDSSGALLGRHEGISGFTIGQRWGVRTARGEPIYVTRIEAASRTVIVGPDSELFHSGLRTGTVNWVSVAAPDGPIRAGIRIRYQSHEAPASVVAQPDGSATVRFDEAQRAIATGQWAVFYDRDTLLGGGVIEGVE